MGELKEVTKIADSSFLTLYERIITSFSKPHDIVLIPYMHLGHFAFEAAINERLCLVYDSNPLIKVNFESEFFYPSVAGLKARFSEIKYRRNCFNSENKQFFHPETFDEVMSIKEFLENGQKDAINLWIRRLVSEALKIPKVDSNEIMALDYIDVKEFAIRTYSMIFADIDPMKLLILHHCIPEFLSDEQELERRLGGHKVRMVHYAPYLFDVQDYYEHNFLKMWFCEISKEQLLWYAGEMESENNLKRDFLSLHKKLDGGGVILVEKEPKQNLDAFFKLAFFYGYENVQAFGSENRELYLLRKIGV